MKHRVLLPELLDTLPQDDPAAIRAREEMLLVNGIMGNHRWIERMLRRHGETGWRITELGAGDGELSLRLINTGLCRAEALHAMDLAPRPKHWPHEAQWSCGDILTQALPDSEIVIANLFLHHFDADQLTALGSKLTGTSQAQHVAPQSRNAEFRFRDGDGPVSVSEYRATTRIVIACEPARKRFHLAQGGLLAALAGFNEVTNHDMLTSIRAGFVRDELPRSLGLPGWRCRVSSTLLGAYHMEAVRPDES